MQKTSYSQKTIKDGDEETPRMCHVCGMYSLYLLG